MEVMRFLKTSRADLRPWIDKWADHVHSMNALDSAVIHMPGMICRISCPTEEYTTYRLHVISEILHHIHKEELPCLLAHSPGYASQHPGTSVFLHINESNGNTYFANVIMK